LTAVLLTAIGGDIAQGAAKVLREMSPELRLVGVDMDDRHGGELYVDALYRVPPATHPEYSAGLVTTAEKEQVDFVLPLSEPELSVLLPKFAEAFSFRWIHAGIQVLENGLDKLTTIKALEQLGWKAPWTVDASESLPKAYPCVFKSRFGSGSRNIHLIQSEKEASFFSERVPQGIFQEVLPEDGGEVTCAVFRDHEGRIAVLQILRKLTGGLTGWGKVVRDEATETLCRSLAEGWDLRGTMNVQLRITLDGPMVFEVNPRISSTAYLRHLLGFSDVWWTVADAMGVKSDFPEIQTGKVMVRTCGGRIL